MISMRLLHSAAWVVGILAVMLAAAIAGTPPTVSADSSECYSGVRVKSITASPSTTRAGDGVVSMELIVENTERKDRQVWLKVTAEDPNGSEAKVWEWGPHIIPKTTGIWGFGTPGETHSSSSWAIPADASPGAYTMNALVLSEDKTQECDSKLEGASFTVLSSDSPLIVSTSPPEDLLLKKGYSRTFTASATDSNNDLSEYEWYIGDERRVRQPIGPTGSHTSEFPQTFSIPGTYHVKATFKDNGGRSDSFTWTVEVSDLSEFCQGEGNPLICGHASEWAHEGYVPTDTTVTVKLSPPSATGGLRNLEITIDDPEKQGSTGFLNVVAPKAAWVDYAGIRKSIKVEETPGVWSNLSQQDERDNFVTDESGSTVWGLVPVLGWFLSIGELFFDTLPQPLTPSGKAFQETYRNCFSNIMIPWHGPIGLKGVRLSIPIDLADGDYVAMAAGFDAFEWKYQDGEKYDKKIESAFIEIHDVLNSEQNDDPPPCARTQRTDTGSASETHSGAVPAPAPATGPVVSATPIAGPDYSSIPAPEQTLENFEDFDGLGDEMSAAKNNVPQGIWSDWATVWVADAEDDKIYAYDLKTKARAANHDFDTLHAAGNDSPAGIWSDGVTMWVADSQDKRVYAYHAESKARDPAKDFSVGGSSTVLTGIWSDGATMWIADSHADKIYAYDLKTRAQASGKDFATLKGAGNIQPASIWSDGKSMWVADSSDQKIYAYDMTTKAQVPAKDFETLKAASNNNPFGIWSNGTTMLVSDHNDDKIYAYNMPSAPGVSIQPPKPVVETPAFDRNAAMDLTGLAAAKNNYPLGIWSDWATIWVADPEDDKIYAYDLKTKARAANHDFDTLHAAGNDSPAGIWSDGVTMWVADSQDKRVYAYHAESKARDPAKDFSVGGSSTVLTGIWSDGATMWIADSHADKIYAYDLKTRAQASGKDFATLKGAGNIQPASIWSDGKSMWVADSSDQKIYAYDMTTKAQVPAKDFETLKAASNNNPFGIWSNGTTMLVSDHNDDKIYAYNMPSAPGVSIQPPKPVVETPAFDRNAAMDLTGLAAAKNNYPLGIWSDWATIWVADPEDDKIYAYDLKTKARAANHDFDTLHAAGNDSPAGIWSDGVTMWVADSQDKRVYAYHAESKARDPAKDFSVGGSSTVLTGIWSDGATMWIADSHADKIYAYDLKTRAQASGKDFATLKGAGNIQPTSIWSDGTTMWVGDSQDDKIYAYDLKTKAQVPAKDFETLKAAGNTTPFGVWSNGTTMRVSDATADKIYAYNMPSAPGVSIQPPKPVVETPAFDRNAAMDLTGLAAAKNNYPLGIWSDWATIWVADPEDDKIYAYDLKTKARAANHDFDTLHAAGNDSPAGIWSDGVTMWVADSQDKRVYAYHAESKARDPAKDFSVGGSSTVLTGIWSDGATMWIADSHADKIYAYDLKTRAQASGKDFATLKGAGNIQPASIWSDGKSMWVADSTDQKIYAYDMTTKAQVPAKDFETLKAASNNNPFGIWSNGTTMLVSDHNDDKIYAYNMPPAADTHVEPPESDTDEIATIQGSASN